MRLDVKLWWAAVRGADPVRTRAGGVSKKVLSYGSILKTCSQDHRYKPTLIPQLRRIILLLYLCRLLLKLKSKAESKSSSHLYDLNVDFSVLFGPLCSTE